MVEQIVVLLLVLRLHLVEVVILSPPTVTISNEVSEKNYIEIPGISTATGIATVSAGGTVSNIIF